MVKETINKMNSHPTEWEKIFTSNVSDKGLISKIHNKLIQFKAKRNKSFNSSLKMGKRSE